MTKNEAQKELNKLSEFASDNVKNVIHTVVTYMDSIFVEDEQIPINLQNHIILGDSQLSSKDLNWALKLNQICNNLYSKKFDPGIWLIDHNNKIPGQFISCIISVIEKILTFLYIFVSFLFAIKVLPNPLESDNGSYENIFFIIEVVIPPILAFIICIVNLVVYKIRVEYYKKKGYQLSYEELMAYKYSDQKRLILYSIIAWVMSENRKKYDQIISNQNKIFETLKTTIDGLDDIRNEIEKEEIITMYENKLDFSIYYKQISPNKRKLIQKLKIISFSNESKVLLCECPDHNVETTLKTFFPKLQCIEFVKQDNGYFVLGESLFRKMDDIAITGGEYVKSMEYRCFEFTDIYDKEAFLKKRNLYNIIDPCEIDKYF